MSIYLYMYTSIYIRINIDIAAVDNAITASLIMLTLYL